MADEYLNVCARIDAMTAHDMAAYAVEFAEYEASEYEKLFYEVVDAVSPEAAASLVQRKDAFVVQNPTARRTDWFEMAELAPDTLMQARFCD